MIYNSLLFISDHYLSLIHRLKFKKFIYLFQQKPVKNSDEEDEMYEDEEDVIIQNLLTKINIFYIFLRIET